MFLMTRPLNDSQLDRLSETLANFGLLLFASLVIPTLSGIDRADLFKLLLGLVGGLSSFVMSLFLLKGVEK